ncbi:MAG: hypothetical protein IPO08_19725 [Xanthomonadales bacterium]|nr:hypothetical protein [Xanthomonadales bacterium]
MTDKHTLVERLNNSDWGPNVTDALTRWAMERAEAANRITALEAREAELVERLSNASEELEYFVEFARRQSEFEGDADAGFAVVREARATLAKARQSDEGE